MPSLLLEAEASEAEMAQAGSVIAFAAFHSEALDAQADVVFPAEVYAEKEGTVTHPDGRVQRVRQAIGHAAGTRAGWSVLAELCERLGAGTGALSSTAVTALIAEAVPFYAGLTLDEIGGDGVRWQDRDAAAALPAAELPPTRSSSRPRPPTACVARGRAHALGRAPRSSTPPRSASSPRASAPGCRSRTRAGSTSRAATRSSSSRTATASARSP